VQLSYSDRPGAPVSMQVQTFGTGSSQMTLPHWLRSILTSPGQYHPTVSAAFPPCTHERRFLSKLAVYGHVGRMDIGPANGKSRIKPALLQEHKGIYDIKVRHARPRMGCISGGVPATTICRAVMLGAPAATRPGALRHSCPVGACRPSAFEKAMGSSRRPSVWKSLVPSHA